MLRISVLSHSSLVSVMHGSSLFLVTINVSFAFMFFGVLGHFFYSRGKGFGFGPEHVRRTLQERSMSAMALRLRLAVAMISSWRQEFPAATAFAVAMVIPLVIRMKSSGEVVFAGGSELQNTCVAGRPGTELWCCPKPRAGPLPSPQHQTRGHSPSALVWCVQLWPLKLWFPLWPRPPPPSQSSAETSRWSPSPAAAK